MRRDLDVSGLSTTVFGVRETMWWGTLLLMIIEGTMMALLVVSYFYIRAHQDLWPPVPLGRAATSWAIAGLVVAAVSIAPIFLSDRAARAGRFHAMRLWITVGTLLELAFLGARALELRALPFRWFDSAHASLVYVILGVHTFHLIVDSLESIVLVVLLFVGPVEDKHRIDVHVNALYWYVIAAGWVPLFALIYLDGFGSW
jgi:cytochrome c oxidase subunit 3